jgi:hypothetical protein
MEIKAKTRTQQILTVMYILAWVAFVGFSIEVGAILFNYIFSVVNPESSQNLYSGVSLHALKEYNFWHYTLRISFVVGGLMLKANAAQLAIKTLAKVKIENPFQHDVAMMIERISYVLFGAWITAMMQNAQTLWLSKNTDLDLSWASGEFIFAAGVVYVIAQIFKRGVEIQSEQELTV